jgi:hypothetical protein
MSLQGRIITADYSEMGTDEMSVVLVEAKQLLLKLYKALG